ncbi:SDR family oxidoreductase [Myxococcus sp. CA056]|uniref:SDR family oxidoreductase n=1 Tax=Myxococcus sp. CA056 TaxID=2741740 RepID=UPI00157A50E2|nr:SDR family oxidoreductase [Myxococcus sp. CA056]NTX14947.1 SDR family oxidoreductase [Myxococcus sp. CA056]
MILVTGANGTVGSLVVQQLVEAGQRVRILVRDTAKASKHGGAVEVVQGDLARPETLGAAFAGIEKLFLLTTGPARIELHGLDAARAAGVRHVVKFSSMGFGPTRDALAIGNWHRDVEAALESSGLAWTVLLAGGFNTNALGWAHTLKTQGTAFAATGEGKVAVVDPRDLAAVAVSSLTQPGHEGKRYELTGPQALSFDEQVALIGAAVGRPLRFVDVPPSAARDAMSQAGMPAPLVEGMLEVMATIKAGGAVTVSPAIEQVLGRKPRTFAAWANEHAAAFR